MFSTIIIKFQKNIYLIFYGLTIILSLSAAWLLRNMIVLLFDTSGFTSKSNYFELTNELKKEQGNLLADEVYFSIPQGSFIRASASVTESGIDVGDINELQLTGILAGAPRFSRALIRKKGESTAEAYALGEQVSGYTLVAMFVDFVELKSGGTSGDVRPLRIYDPGYEKLIQPNQVSSGKVEKIVLSRDRFLQYLKDQGELFRVKFAPELADGKIKGWRLLLVPEDHFLYSMGARSGDTIRRFNGQELESQERLIQMWQSLKTLNNITIDLERNGGTNTYNVIIQ